MTAHYDIEPNSFARNGGAGRCSKCGLVAPPCAMCRDRNHDGIGNVGGQVRQGGIPALSALAERMREATRMMIVDAAPITAAVRNVNSEPSL